MNERVSPATTEIVLLDPSKSQFPVELCFTTSAIFPSPGIGTPKFVRLYEVPPITPSAFWYWGGACGPADHVPVETKEHDDAPDGTVTVAPGIVFASTVTVPPPTYFVIVTESDVESFP